MAVCQTCAAELPDAARFCPACGSRIGGRVGDERKFVTILFADLVGSTAGADARDPEDVRAALRPQLARMREALEQFGGTFEKYVGDAVMAVFGAPVSHEDDPERAVRAALAIREALPRVRVAVHTGEAVVSLGAASGTGEGIATGDVVNTAFRIEEAAPDGTVLVGEPTYRATRAVVEYGERRLLEAKGKGAPVAVYEALHPRSDVPTPSERAPLAPLVGRREELSLVLDTLARARRDRTVQLVTLVGAPGIGKSRLIWELERALEHDPGLVTWRRGRCLPYGDGVTFWALGEIVKAQAGILETDGPEETEAKVGRAVRDLLADRGEAAWVEEQLRPVVGLASRSLPEERREELFDAWTGFFEALAEWGPLVLVFEDVHWADEALLDFLDHLADWARGPLVLLCSARPELHERRPRWGARANAVTIALAPLTKEETGKLVAFLLRRPSLPAELQEELLQRAEGNPLYAEEFVRMLADRDDLTGGDPGEELGVRELPLPESLQGLIAARLDVLSPEEKAVLQDAAVIGRAFWPGAVASIADIPVEEVTRRLRLLVRKELVRAQRSSTVAHESEYVFHHTLVRDVAYRQIPRAQRSAKHLAAADWLEAVVAHRQDRVELLAHHLWKATVLARAVGQEAGSPTERAIHALREAAGRALALNSFEAAANYLGAALELLPDGHAERAEILFQYGKSLYSDRGEGADQLTAARDALLAAGRIEQAAEAEILLANVALWGRGDHDAAFEHLAHAQEHVAGVGPSPAKASILGSVATFLGLADEHEQALEAAKGALEIAESLDSPEARARALRAIGWLRAVRGEPRGLDDLRASIGLHESIDSPDVVVGYVNLAGVHIVLGDIERAVRALDEGRQAAERFPRAYGSRWLLDVSRVSEDYWFGRWDAAVVRANAIVAHGNAGSVSRPLEVWTRLVRGQIHLARGEADAAIEDARWAVEGGRSAKDAQLLYPALAFLGRALVYGGDSAAPAAPTDELLDRLTGEEWCMDAFWIDLAATLLIQNRRADLAAAVAKVRSRTRWVEVAAALAANEPVLAIERCAAIGSSPDDAFVRLLGARDLMAAGRDEDARREASAAAASFRSMGAAAYVRELERLGAGV